MKKLIAISALAAFGCVALMESAGAQVTVPDNEQFYATPLSHGVSLFAPGVIVSPPAAPVPVAAPPAPAPVKRRVRRRKAT